jgi:hypothetical protein
MELVGDVGHVESRFGPFGDSEIALDARDGTPRWRGSCEILFLVHLETVLVPVQDRCIVCAEHTTGSEIILDAHDGTTRWRGRVESRFGLFGDNVNVGPFGDSANVDAR